MSTPSFANPEMCKDLLSSKNTEVVENNPSRSGQIIPIKSGLIEIHDRETKPHSNLDLFSAGEETLVTKQVKYITEGVSGLIVEEHLVSPTQIISLRNQTRLFSSSEVLTELSKSIEKKFDVRIVDIDMQSPIILGTNLVFLAKTNQGSYMYLKYDYLKKNLSSISTLNLKNESAEPVIRSLSSDRYILSETPGTKTTPSVYEIVDLKTNRKISFEFNESHKAYIKLSSDALAFSVTYHNFKEKTQENRVYAINKSQWQENGVPQSLSELKLLREFQGKMLGADSKLKRFVVDDSRNFNEIEPMILDFTESRPKKLLITDWAQIRNKLKKAELGGLTINFTETETKLSADGNYFSMKIRLFNEANKTQSRKDLFFLWNLQVNYPPRVITTEDLNTVMSSEPSIKNNGNTATGIAWARQTKSHLLDDGTLIIARSLVLSSRKDIVILPEENGLGFMHIYQKFFRSQLVFYS